MKRLLLVLALALVGGTAYVVGHDALYRWLALRAVERAAGATVRVDGTFDVDHGFPLAVDAGDITLSGVAGEVGVRRLALRMHVWPLLRGDVHLESLVVSGVDARLTVAPPAPRPRRPVRLRVPLVEQLEVDDVTVRARHHESGAERLVRIEALRLGAEPQGLMRARGEGSIDGAEVRLEGTFGALDDLLGAGEPYPIDVQLRIPDWAMEADVSGSVAQPLTGRGLRLEVRARVADVRPLMALTAPDLPADFGLEATAVLGGDTAAVRIRDLRLTVASPERRALRVSGSVDDASRLSGIELDVEADARRAFLSLVAAYLPTPLESVTGTARLRGDADALVLRELDVDARTSRGIRLRVGGVLDLETGPGDAAGVRGADARLEVEVPAAALGARTPWLRDDASIAGSADVRGAGGVLALENLQVRADGPGDVRKTFTGRLPLATADVIALFRAERPWDAFVAHLVRGSAIDVRLEAPALAELEPATGPLGVEPGAWTLTARAQGTGERLAAENVRLRAEREDGLLVAVSGSVAELAPLLTGSVDGVRGLALEGTVTAPGTAALGAALGIRLPDLGRLDASVAVSDEDGWSLPRVAVNVANGAGFQATLEGSASGLAAGPRVRGTLSARAPDARAVLAGAGPAPGRSAGGALDLSGTLAGEPGAVTLDGALAVGETRFDARLAVETGGERPRVAGSLESPLIRLADLGMRHEEAGAERPRRSWAEWLEQPLAVDWMRAVDLDLSLRAAEVHGDRIRARDLVTRIALEDARLEVDPLSVTFEGGSIGATASVDAAAEPPRVSIRGQGKDLSMGALADQLMAEPIGLEGQLTLSADLAGAGNTFGEVVATLDGRFAHAIENGKLPGANIDLLGLRVTQLLLSTFSGRSRSELDCFLSELRIEDGRARTDAFYLATPNIEASGVGALDLRDGAIDLVVTTESRRRLLLKRGATVRVSGTLASPVLDTGVEVGAAGVAVGAAGLTMLPTVGLPLAGLTTLNELVASDPGTPCKAPGDAGEARPVEPAAEPADGAGEDVPPGPGSG